MIKTFKYIYKKKVLKIITQLQFSHWFLKSFCLVLSCMAPIPYITFWKWNSSFFFLESCSPCSDSHLGSKRLSPSCCLDQNPWSHPWPLSSSLISNPTCQQFVLALPAKCIQNIISSHFLYCDHPALVTANSISLISYCNCLN